MNPDASKWLRLSIKVGLLVLAGFAWWLTEHRQSEFGKEYVHELQKLHSELGIETIDFSDDRSYVIFEVSVDKYPDAKTHEYLAILAFDIRRVYCAQISNLQPDHNIELFHVNVRAVSDNGSNIILSHALSKDSCA